MNGQTLYSFDTSALMDAMKRVYPPVGMTTGFGPTVMV